MTPEFAFVIVFIVVLIAATLMIGNAFAGGFAAVGIALSVWFFMGGASNLPPVGPGLNPAPPAVAAPAPNPAVNTGTGGTYTGAPVNTLDGRSSESRTTAPTTALGFAPYQDTGVGKNKTWSLNVPVGYTAIVGGVNVNGSAGGNLNAYKGPTTVNANVTDGFYTVVPNDAANTEFCMRYKQHKENGWLLTNIHPIEGWNKC